MSVEVDPQRFAVGAGRTRPAHKPKELSCPNCGAPIALPDERGQVVVCGHCRSEVELSHEEARAIGTVGDPPKGLVLPVGAPFLWDGVRYEVVGRTQRCDLGEPEYQTFGYLLYHPQHPSLWLSCYANQWALGRKTRVMARGDAFTKSAGDPLQSFDNQNWVCIEVGTSELLYVDGALPWVARVGDQTRHAEFHRSQNEDLLYEVERNAMGEIEQSFATRLSPEQMEAATEGAVSAKDVLTPAMVAEWGDSPRLRLVGLIWLVFGLVSLITAIALSAGGKQLASANLPPSGGEVGPITTTKANVVLEVDVRQRFNQDGWSFVEAEVLDEDENYLFGFGEELWAESGYDDGAWHEEKNDYDLRVTIPEPGEYYLGFKTESGAQGAARPGARVGQEIRVTVSSHRASTVPFWTAGILGVLAGLFMWEAATGRIRKKLSEIETD